MTLRKAAGSPGASGRRIDRQDMQIIEVLSSEYSGVYLVDLKTGQATPYSMTDGVTGGSGNLFGGECRYIDAFRACVEGIAHPEDRERMLEAGTVGNIMKELRHKKTFRTVFRNTQNKYCEMKFIKVGGEEDMPESVALCFSEKDEELRAKTEAADRQEKNMDIISIFSSDYFLVSRIDLETGAYDTYSFDGEKENGPGGAFRSGDSYSAAYKTFVSTQVCEEDRERMERAGAVFTILEALRGSTTYVTRYRNKYGRYNEMKFVRVGDEEYPKTVAVGFADRDAEIRKDIQRDSFRRVYLELTSDYACVFRVDAFADPKENVTSFRDSELLCRMIPDWKETCGFEEGLIKLRDRFVAPENRENFLASLEKDRILEALRRQPACYVRFYALIEGERVLYEFKFSADRDADGVLTGLVGGLHRVWSSM